MKVLYSWLKDFVDIEDSPEVLSDKLVKAGFEVEEIIDLSQEIQKVVIGQVLSVEKHPDADKLHVCMVNVGDDEPIQIVCGANNVSEGIKVPVCKHGAVLPGGYKIKKGKIRGVKSFGMMCGGSEIGLTEADFEGANDLGLFILPEDSQIGMDINEYIGTNDYILDIGVTANRPDCNSIIGIAKEICAVTNKQFKDYSFNITEVSEKTADVLDVKVENKTLCPRYMAKAVKNIKIEKSSDLIRKRLRLSGLRPINNIVDITNYVLLEIGQPMHAFDTRFIEGNEIIVRNAKDKEEIVALDGETYKLSTSMLAICDSKKPVAIAGIMGGEHSGVVNDTKDIIFESAKFARDNIRRSSRELNLRSDSSARFEKGVDFSTQELAINRAISLLNDGEVLSGCIDTLEKLPEEKTVEFTQNDITKILGIEIENETILNSLNCLCLDTTLENGVFTTLVPLSRDDIEGVNDIAEEVIRLYGYDHIEIKSLPVRGGKSQEQTLQSKIKNLLVSNSMNEIVTYSFTTAKSFDKLNLAQDNKLRNGIKLANALGEDFSVMRTNLVHNMISTIESNYKKGNKEARLFEIAKIYLPKELPLTELPVELDKISLGVYGNDEDFFTLKGVVENIYAMAGLKVTYERANVEFLHPGISANVIFNGEVIGKFGQVHPDVQKNYGIKTKLYVAELDLSAIIDNYTVIKPFKAIPKYPAIDRDIALIMKEDVAVGDIMNYISDFHKLIEDVTLFDIYQGDQIAKGMKSVALSVVYRDNDKTLKIEETNNLTDKLLKKLEEQFNAKLRL